VNGQAAAVGTQIVLASGALLTVQANGSYRYDPNGKFAALNNGQTASDQFTYSLMDGQGASASASVTITILGITQTPPTLPNSIAGTVYVDVNNNGVRGALEIGIRYVMVHLEGPVSRTVQTDVDGKYSFTDLPPGLYTVTQAQPQAFMDGIDTRGEPLLGTLANNQFVGIQLTSNIHATGYNFGERGLTNPNKKLSLASTSLDWDLIQPLLPENQLDALWAQLSGLPPPIELPPTDIFSTQNPRNPLDVTDDGVIAADDVLTIINRINAGPAANSAALRSINVSAPYHDTTGDGVVAADDVLKVINFINSRRTEGECGSDAMSFAGSTTSTAVTDQSMEADQHTLNDSLLDLLAEDINYLRRKKTP